MGRFTTAKPRSRHDKKYKDVRFHVGIYGEEKRCFHFSKAQLSLQSYYFKKVLGGEIKPNRSFARFMTIEYPSRKSVVITLDGISPALFSIFHRSITSPTSKLLDNTNYEPNERTEILLGLGILADLFSMPVLQNKVTQTIKKGILARTRLDFCYIDWQAFDDNTNSELSGVDSSHRRLIVDHWAFEPAYTSLESLSSRLAQEITATKERYWKFVLDLRCYGYIIPTIQEESARKQALETGIIYRVDNQTGKPVTEYQDWWMQKKYVEKFFRLIDPLPPTYKAPKKGIRRRESCPESWTSMRAYEAWGGRYRTKCEDCSGCVLCSICLACKTCGTSTVCIRRCEMCDKSKLLIPHEVETSSSPQDWRGQQELIRTAVNALFKQRSARR